MAVGRDVTVMELDGPRLTAVSALVSGGGVEVTRWISVTRPDSVGGDRAAAVGEWIGAELRKAGLSRSRVVLAASRAEVVLKQLSLPAGEQASETDIAGAVRLQMVRQLSMPLEGTAIDYAPMGEVEGGFVSVLAGAMPADRVGWWREVSSAGGISLKRIGLRCAGAAALLADLSQRKAGAILGVAVGAATTELVIVEDGQMMLARAVDAPRPSSREEVEGFAEKLAVEAKRTWVSHRSTRAGVDAEAIAAIGEADLTRRVGEVCAAAVGAPCEVVTLPGMVRMPEAMPADQRAAAMPLVGLLLEEVMGRERLDFANPRKLPDRAAVARQRGLIALAVLVAVFGGGFALARKKLNEAEARLSALQKDESEKRKEVDQLMVLHAKINHIEQWERAKVDWLAHLRELSDQLPDPRDAQVGELSGRMAGGAVYESKGKPYPNGEWGAREQAVFEISGNVDTRQVATDLRERLLSGGVYRVESRGPDMQDRFALELVTAEGSPRAAEAVPAKKTAKSEKPAKKAPTPTPVTQASDSGAGGGK
jgi:hypothetical protein